uniref:Uncharacterized protein n=1 Tax=Cacopsylla melanoneura TaxID=428564 RepID=A0A8D8ZEF6_9HEMI
MSVFVLGFKNDKRSILLEIKAPGKKFKEYLYIDISLKVRGQRMVHWVKLIKTYLTVTEKTIHGEVNLDKEVISSKGTRKIFENSQHQKTSEWLARDSKGSKAQAASKYIHHQLT